MSTSSQKETQSDYQTLDNNFWVIREGSNIDVPGVLWDTQTGKHGVLLFTSRDTAVKFCKMQDPSLIEKLVPLTRRVVGDEHGNVTVIQSGLVRIARRIMVNKMEGDIPHFIIDHPGTKGIAKFVSVEEVAFGNRTKVDSKVSTKKMQDIIKDALYNDE